MPLFDFRCTACNNVTEHYLPLQNTDDPISCKICGSPKQKMLPFTYCRNFEAQVVTDIGDKPVYVRNKQELTDAINRFNDSHLAHQHGKARIYEKLHKKEF